MKIKTITHRLSDAIGFDEAVNKALAAGWTLTKRTVLQPPSQPNNGNNYMFNMLYAELEKDDTADIEPPVEVARPCCCCTHYDDETGYCEGCLDKSKWEFKA